MQIPGAKLSSTFLFIVFVVSKKLQINCFSIVLIKRYANTTVLLDLFTHVLLRQYIVYQKIEILV